MPLRRRLAWAPGNRSIAVVLFVLALAVYLANGRVLPGNDATPNVYTATQVLRFGELLFAPMQTPFMFTWELRDDHGSARVTFANSDTRPPGRHRSYSELFAAGQLRVVDYSYYLVPTVRRAGSGEQLFASTFGPAAGLIAVPVALALAHFGIDARTDLRAGWTVAKLTASLLVAASVALLYLSAAGFLAARRAVLLALTYAFATCVWSISSQTLWQQTPAIFFLSLGTWSLLRIEASSWRGAVTGFAFSAAFACRPTAALVLSVAALYMLVWDRRALVAFVVWAAPIAILLAWYNAFYFGSPFSFGQLDVGRAIALTKTGLADPWQTPVWLGAAGLLVSPSRGLLVYSPVLILAFAGSVLAWRDARYARLRVFSLLVLVLWLPAFKWFDWWGGWSYGYRPIVDSVPFLAVLAIPALQWTLERAAWRVGFVMLLCWSVLVQVLGVFAYSPAAWNARVLPGGATADIDNPAYRHRLWSFQDWQIGDLIANFPVRMNESRDFANEWFRP
jgi:hypothetical protein